MNQKKRTRHSRRSPRLQFRVDKVLPALSLMFLGFCNASASEEFRSIGVVGNGSLWESPVVPATPAQGWKDGSEPLHQIRSDSKVTGDLSGKGSIRVHSAVRLLPSTSGLVATLGSADTEIGWQKNPAPLGAAGTFSRMYAWRSIGPMDSNASSAITLTAGGIAGYSSGRGFEEINFLPAIYDTNFKLTCYVLAREIEGKFSSGKKIPILVAKKALLVNSKFLKDAGVQGTGQLEDGRFIQPIVKAKRIVGWNFAVCPTTRAGTCAVDRQTAAVDPSVIPLRSSVAIHPSDSVWHAADSGGEVKGHHIDQYFGIRRSECEAHGVRHAGRVKLVHRQFIAAR